MYFVLLRGDKMTIIIKTGILLLNLVYAVIKLLPSGNKVVFISRQSDYPSIEFRMIKEEIQRRDNQVKTVMLCKTIDGGINSTLINKIKYALHMFRQMIHIATAKVVILDSYCIVISVLNHKKKLKVIQMWHSMGTMKKFGYTALDTAEGTKRDLAMTMKMHRNYDYVFASADAYKEHLAKGFNCNIEKIMTMPLPRLDLLNNEEYNRTVRYKIYKAYPDLMKKPVILYCPTFRKDESRFEEVVQNLIDSIDTEKYNLVIKLHPLSKIKIKGNVIFAEEFSSFDMIFVADYFVSDYSCIVYEAAVRGIPLFFYNFDMDLYVDERGLAIDYYNELPGVISKHADVIISAIEEERLYHRYDREKLKKFTDKYIQPTKHATQDIVDFVEKILKNECI